MKIYDQVRGDIAIAMASFVDEYQGKKKLSKYRQNDLEALNRLIHQYDNERDAFKLRRDVKLYVEKMGHTIFSWMKSLSIYQLKQTMLSSVKKPEYKKITLLQTMHHEEKDNTLRVEEQLTTKLERAKKQMLQREGTLKVKLKKADHEILRLRREIKFLTEKLVECHKKLDDVEVSLSIFAGNKSQITLYNHQVQNPKQTLEPNTRQPRRQSQQVVQMSMVAKHPAFWTNKQREQQLVQVPLVPNRLK